MYITKIDFSLLEKLMPLVSLQLPNFAYSINIIISITAHGSSLFNTKSKPIGIEK